MELTAKLPVQAAVHVFGLPEEDLDFVVPRVNVIMTYWSGPQDQPVALDDLLDNLTDLHTYALELVQGKRGKVLPDTVITLRAAWRKAKRTPASNKRLTNSSCCWLRYLRRPIAGPHFAGKWARADIVPPHTG